MYSALVLSITHIFGLSNNYTTIHFQQRHNTIFIYIIAYKKCYMLSAKTRFRDSYTASMQPARDASRAVIFLMQFITLNRIIYKVWIHN